MIRIRSPGIKFTPFILVVESLANFFLSVAVSQDWLEFPRPKQAAAAPPREYFLWTAKEFFLSRDTSWKIYIKGIRQPNPALTPQERADMPAFTLEEACLVNQTLGSESRDSNLALPLKCHWYIILPAGYSQILSVKTRFGIIWVHMVWIEVAMRNLKYTMRQINFIIEDYIQK